MRRPMNTVYLVFQSTPDYLNRENRKIWQQMQMTMVSIHSRLFKPGELPD